jgi:uncharacterized protein
MLEGKHHKRDGIIFLLVQMTQKQRQILEKAENYVRKAMSGEGSGHDWWHVARVKRQAAAIAATEQGCRAYIALCAALLHDIKDWKFAGGDEEAGPKEAGRLMLKFGASGDDAQQVMQIVREVSYKGAGVRTLGTTLEARVVQDADRLDAMGAIGIARCFAYGGSRSRAIFDPAEKPVLHLSFAQYKRSKGSSINHFYEKLLLLKARMQTKEGRRLAAHRDRFMRDYLRAFFREWGVKPLPFGPRRKGA